MATLRELDMDGIAAVGLMFLDGDIFETVLLDRYGHVDYDFDKFNHCKRVLMKIERINPEAKLHAYLWQKRAANMELVEPLVVGSLIPAEGMNTSPLDEAKAKAFAGEVGVTATKASGHTAHYYPVKNSDAEIVGVLELTKDGEVRA